MKNAVNQLSSPLSANFNSLCTNVNANAEFDIQSTTIEGSKAIISQWNLPFELQEFFDSLEVTESTGYQTDVISIRIGESQIEQYIVTGRSVG